MSPASNQPSQSATCALRAAHRTGVLTSTLFITALGLATVGCPKAEPGDAATSEGVQSYVARKAQGEGTNTAAVDSGNRVGSTAAQADATAGSEIAGQPNGDAVIATTGPQARRIQITVVDGVGLPDLDDGPGVTDGYVILEYDGERHQTSVSSGLEPTWGDSFAFEVRPGATLRVTLMDEDMLSDEKVGVTTLSVPTIVRHGQKMLDVPFGGGDNGRVRLKLVGL